MAYVSIPRKQTWLTDLSPAQIKKVQNRLNRFFKKHLKGYTPLRVDGKPGPLTRKHIKYAKWFLGYKGSRTPKVNRALTMRLYAPNNILISTRARVARGQQRRKAHNIACLVPRPRARPASAGTVRSAAGSSFRAPQA